MAEFVNLAGRRFNLNHITSVEPYETTGYTDGWKIRVIVQPEQYILDKVFKMKAACEQHIDKVLGVIVEETINNGQRV